MAQKTSPEEKAYYKAVSDRKEAEGKLNGTAGRGGIEASWLRIQQRYADRNKPGMFTKQIVDEYNLIKTSYEQAAKKYQDALAVETKSKEQFDASVKESNKAEDAKNAADKLAEAKAKKAEADSLVPSRGQAQADAAAKAVIDAQTELDKAQSKPADNTITQGGTPENPYGGYTLSAIDGNVYGPSDDKNNGLEGVFVPTRNAKGELINEFITNSGSQAVKNFLKEYTKPGQIAALQKQLLDSDYIKQSDIAGDTWTAGVLDMLKAYSRDYVSKFQFEGITDVPTIDVFIQSKKAGGKTGGSKSYSTITKRGDAKKELDEYMLDLRGTISTPEEEEAYYKKLRATEQKAVLTIGDGFTTGQKLDQADHILIAVEVAKKSLKGTDVEKLLASGGQAALDIADLQEYSAKYGIEMSAADALKYVATGLGQKDYILKQQERIRQTAITLNPQLKDHFLAGGTYKDIADQYKNAKQRKLGITITDSLKDKDITDAISKGVSINDFNMQLQGKAEWRKTSEANFMVDGFINKLGEMWGLG